MIWIWIAFLLLYPIPVPEAWAAEMDSSILDRRLILNLYGSRQERLDLLKYLTSPKVQERMKKASLDLRQVFRAMQVREFNREMIAELKERGWVGETAQAILAIPPATLESLTADDLRLVQEVSKEENESRETLIQLLGALQEKEGATPAPSQIETPGPAREEVTPGSKGIEAVRKRFGELLRQQARPGEWIQGEDGLWVKKG
ncbi:MAG: DUF1318 domain-containing protein [Candidatus Tectomicrobia bacterium]|uniref:DUF1318 domain-containing protein n=1 Tax=Tectimicrobiota bacterium TaxID=2528274 RepID=A0A932FYG2_UNCTE|nr:DUF1318 domain-containing protein [Candidatus Tectomicrobia bacterium]